MCSASAAVHTTTYGYDAASNLTSRIHDATLATPTYGTYTYNNLNQLAKESDAKSSTDTSPQVSTFSYNPMRWDSTTGQYDMGFRTYDPSLNQFLSRDMYNGALADMGLATDPFTGSQYAFGSGNPISNIESDGHTTCDQWGTCSSTNTPVHVTSSQLGGPAYQKAA